MPRTDSSEKRRGTKERRAAKVERRNPERSAGDLAPRRNPDQPDRRKPS